jgi:hypothetical protein
MKRKQLSGINKCANNNIFRKALTMNHKKIITTILICILAFCVCACGSSNSSSAATSEDSKASSQKASDSQKDSAKTPNASEVYKLKAETVVSPADSAAAKKYFRVYKIKKGDAVYKRIAGRSFKTNGRISLSDLRYVKVLHVGYDKKNACRRADHQPGDCVEDESCVLSVIWQALSDQVDEADRQLL